MNPMHALMLENKIMAWLECRAQLKKPLLSREDTGYLASSASLASGTHQGAFFPISPACASPTSSLPTLGSS